MLSTILSYAADKLEQARSAGTQSIWRYAYATTAEERGLFLHVLSKLSCVFMANTSVFPL